VPSPLPPFRLHFFRRSRRSLAPSLAVLAAFAAGGAAQAQSALPPAPAEGGLLLRRSPALTPPARGETGDLPIFLEAQKIQGQPDGETVAEGKAEFRRGGLRVAADRLSYRQPDDLARAVGNGRIEHEGNRYTGTELELRLQTFEGYFLNPTYFFSRTDGGGSAERIDFLDADRAVATRATYTSCTAEGETGPAWQLSSRRVRFDFATNEGIAEGAVLRFLGVPILAAPVLSFPLSDARKSGWLPPNINLDSKSGLQVAVPYYWNLAPNRDLTLTPSVSARRGVGLGTEFRYLEPNHSGTVNLVLLPDDRLAQRSRYALSLAQDSRLRFDTDLTLRVLRVSDDAYWKDFPRDIDSLTPRLLASNLQISRTIGDWTAYARWQGWQVLQDIDPATRIEAPYQRAPQIGARLARRTWAGFEFGFEAEANRFTNPPEGALVERPTGVRLHALGSIAHPYVAPGWTLTPKLAFNAASYALDRPLADGRRNASRVIPTVSLESAWAFERDTTWFGRAVRQTLEPRLLYVYTPFRAQSHLPNFDAAPKDFNFESIYSDNDFSGVDRVSDAHQVTAGVTTRLLDAATGAESMRLGMVQRFLLRDQSLTCAVIPAGQTDCTPFTRSFSDLLLLASTTLVPNWTLDASVQFNADSRRTVRSIVGARYSPGPYRTFGMTYRLARGLSEPLDNEQVELGWQWPIYGPGPSAAARSGGAKRGGATAGGSGVCSGSWYSVGRVNYSTRDSRVTDSVLGVEYAAGCWIGRVVAERLSTGRTEATTRLLLQLELVGLSRLGSNPLQVLKDNIPGYRLLREDRAGSSTVAPIAPIHD
jgi:LPS-assembly protein